MTGEYRLWYEIAYELGLPVSEAVNSTSSTQFVDWCVFLQMKAEEEWQQSFERRTADQHYYAQIVAKLDNILDSPWFRKTPVKAVTEDYLLTFVTKPVSNTRQRRLKRLRPVKPKRYTTFEDTGITFDEKPLTKQQMAAGLASKVMWLKHHGIEEPKPE